MTGGILVLSAKGTHVEIGKPRRIITVEPAAEPLIEPAPLEEPTEEPVPVGPDER